VSDVRDLLSDVAESVPVAPIDRVERALGLARRRRRSKVITAGAVLAVTVLTFVVAAPLAARLATREQLGPAGVPNRAYQVPLHAPSVGPGSPLGQRASLLLGGLPRATGWIGSSCCSLAVVGASTDVSAFLDLPGLVPADARSMPVHLSPDGRTIAYSSGSAVQLVDLVDGGVRSLVPSDHSSVRQVLGWSADQAWLLVATKAGAVTHLAAVSVDGTVWTTLSAPASWSGSSHAAAISDDGRAVAYVQEGELRIVSTQGSAPSRLVRYLEYPEVNWYGHGEVMVATTATAPDGLVHLGAHPQLEVVDVPSGTTETVDLGGEFDSANMVPGGVVRPDGDWLFVLSKSSGRTIERYDGHTGRYQRAVILPAGTDPLQVEIAIDLLATGTRTATEASDPSHAAGAVAVGVGLLAAIAVPLVLLRPRRSR
jgi:WD40-like Beta Propeller Repeat